MRPYEDSSKSHVSLEQHQCKVCTDTFDTGAILLDRKLTPRFGRTTITGYGLCPSCTEKRAADYIAVIEVDPTRSGTIDGDTLSPSQAFRTGRVAHIRRHVMPLIFDCPIRDDEYMAFIEIDAFEMVVSLSGKRKDTLQ